MAHPILVTGAAGGTQGSTGRLTASLLLQQGFPVRALVHKLDSRSDELRQQGAEVVEGGVHDCLRRLAFKALRELSDLQPGDLDPQYTNGTSFRVRRAYSSNAVP